MPSTQPWRATLLMLAAVGLITVIDTINKYFTADLHAVQLVWGYFVGIFVTLCLYFLARRESLADLLRTSQPKLQWLRSIFLVASIISLFIGLTYLPIAEATAIGFMSPLFLTALSVPILKERVGRHRWLAVIAGLIGVIIIVRPGGGIWHWASAMPFVGAICFALFQLITRMLALRERTDPTLFYTGLGGLLWSSALVPFFWTPPTAVHWLVFLGTGAMGAVAHICLIRAFVLAQASLLAPLNYSKLIWAALLGYLVFGDLPSLNTLAGGGVIIIAGVYVMYRESRLQAEDQSS